jgi:RNA polymerase sigma factor (sigma-70 family)
MRAARVSLDEAEELASELTLKVMAGKARIPLGVEALAYLAAAARNMQRNRERDARREAGRLNRALPLTPRGVTPHSADSLDPAEIVGHREQILAGLDAFNALPANEREVMYHRHVKGLKRREVAALLGIKPTQVDVRERQARARLAKRLGVPRESAPGVFAALGLRWSRTASAALTPPVVTVVGTALAVFVAVATPSRALVYVTSPTTSGGGTFEGGGLSNGVPTRRDAGSGVRTAAIPPAANRSPRPGAPQSGQRDPVNVGVKGCAEVGTTEPKPRACVSKRKASDPPPRFSGDVCRVPAAGDVGEVSQNVTPLADYVPDNPVAECESGSADTYVLPPPGQDPPGDNGKSLPSDPASREP